MSVFCPLYRLDQKSIHIALIVLFTCSVNSWNVLPAVNTLFDANIQLTINPMMFMSGSLVLFAWLISPRFSSDWVIIVDDIYSSSRD